MNDSINFQAGISKANVSLLKLILALINSKIKYKFKSRKYFQGMSGI